MALDTRFTGVNPRWKSRKAIVANLDARPQNWYLQSVSEIEQYNRRSPQSGGRTQNENNSPPFFEYAAAGRSLLLSAAANALRGADWLPQAHEAIAYEMLSSRLGFYWHWKFRQIFPSHPTPMRLMGWEKMIEAMSFGFIFGWIEQAVYEGYLICQVFKNEYYALQSYRDGHRRAHAFMLRLFCDLEGEVSHEWPGWAYEVPCYEFLLSKWRTNDFEELIPALMEACDRHTFESHHESAKKAYDFYDESMMRTPIEILMVFRLRNMLGLENPILNHPLMDVPFDRLPEPQRAGPLDERMIGTLERVRQDWLDFDRVTAIDVMKTY